MNDVVPEVVRRLSAVPVARRTPTYGVPVLAPLEWTDRAIESCEGWALEWAWFGIGPQVRCRLTSVRLGQTIETWVSADHVHVR